MEKINLSDDKKFYTPQEIGEILGVENVTILNWIKKGAVSAMRTLGGHYRITREDLIRFLKQNSFEVVEPETGYKVLVVEDDPDVRDFEIQAIEILKTRSVEIKVDIATDGFTAGKKFMEFKPNVVVLDLMLPGLNGFEICEMIKKNKETNFIKILAVTGYDTKENREKILQTGADDYLAKPFTLRDFQEKLCALLKIEEKAEKVEDSSPQN